MNELIEARDPPGITDVVLQWREEMTRAVIGSAGVMRGQTDAVDPSARTCIRCTPPQLHAVRARGAGLPGQVPSRLVALSLSLLGCAERPVTAPVDAGRPQDQATALVVPDATMDAVGVAPDAVTEPLDTGGADGAPDGANDAGRPTVLRVRYPLRDRRITLRGDAVGVLNWTRGIAFRRVDDELVEWSSGSVSAPFEWKPLLDDAIWSQGPNFRARPGETSEVWARFLTQVGVARRRSGTVRSEVLANERGLWIYLPPSYSEQPSRRFPVVYMHDGQNLFDPAAAFGGVAWEADNAMNAGAADGTIREAIVVGVENTAARIDEYTPSVDRGLMRGGRAPQYLTFFVDELMPLVNRELRTLTGPENTAIVGSSLGGLVSVWIGLRRADVFGAVGALSPSTWWDQRMILDEVARASGPRARRIWVDSGDSGPSRDGLEDTRALAQALQTAGYREGEALRYVVQPGAMHNEAAWRSRLPDVLRFLLGPREP